MSLVLSLTKRILGEAVGDWFRGRGTDRKGLGVRLIHGQRGKKDATMPAEEVDSLFPEAECKDGLPSRKADYRDATRIWQESVE